MKKNFAVFALALLLVSAASVFGGGCGSRTPSPTSAHDKIQKHFVKYGKKYKLSDFGRHRIQRVEIVEVRELQKGMAEADAYAYLADGPVYKVRATFSKKPLGWKLVSWESLGGS